MSKLNNKPFCKFTMLSFFISFCDYNNYMIPGKIRNLKYIDLVKDVISKVMRIQKDTFEECKHKSNMNNFYILQYLVGVN